MTDSGADFLNYFASYAELLRLGPNFCASKKLFKKWAQGAKVGCRGAKLFMKLTPGTPFLFSLKRQWKERGNIFLTLTKVAKFGEEKKSCSNIFFLAVTVYNS